jgi:transcriptional regulator of heat shock response
MSSANVLSLEALKEFFIELQHFRTGLLKELESLDLELRRLSQWIQVDSAKYWNDEHQQIKRRLSECLQQLSRCMSYVREDERRPCTEEKKRVAKAKERAALCESKIRIVQAASTHWESRTAKTRTKLQRCRDMAESELLSALNKLQTHIERLEAYNQLRSPISFSPTDSSPTTRDLDQTPDSNPTDHEPVDTSE